MQWEEGERRERREGEGSDQKEMGAVWQRGGRDGDEEKRKG